jgi:hypothetical protein
MTCGICGQKTNRIHKNVAECLKSMSADLNRLHEKLDALPTCYCEAPKDEAGVCEREKAVTG